jgi:hypothetical protein
MDQSGLEWLTAPGNIKHLIDYWLHRYPENPTSSQLLGVQIWTADHNIYILAFCLRFLGFHSG